SRTTPAQSDSAGCPGAADDAAGAALFPLDHLRVSEELKSGIQGSIPARHLSHSSLTPVWIARVELIQRASVQRIEIAAILARSLRIKRGLCAFFPCPSERVSIWPRHLEMPVEKPQQRAQSLISDVRRAADCAQRPTMRSE